MLVYERFRCAAVMLLLLDYSVIINRIWLNPCNQQPVYRKSINKFGHFKFYGFAYFWFHVENTKVEQVKRCSPFSKFTL